MSVKLEQFDSQLWELLHEEATAEFIGADILQNGLQVSGTDEVKKVGFGVSASLRLFEMAKEQGCDVVVVHHGLILPAKEFDSPLMNRFSFLIKNDISLWTAHYVLDAHSKLGNNVQLLRAVGANPTERYVDFSGAPWGWFGEFDQPLSLDAIVSAYGDLLSPSTIVYDFGPKEISRVAAVSGSGAPSAAHFDVLIEKEVDLYIVGDVREWHQEYFREAGINCIAGGHYNTETFGPKALMQYVESNFDVETVWLDVPNQV